MTLVLLSLSIPAGPVVGQSTVSLDLFGGATAPVGALADVTTRSPGFHVGAGLSYAFSARWGLRAEASLHQFEERTFGSTQIGDDGPTHHLGLWHFFLLGQYTAVSSDRVDVRVEGGPGLTLTGSDQRLERLRLLDGRSVWIPPQRFSHSEPALKVGMDAGYRVGPGEVFLRAGTVLTGLTENFSGSFYQDLSGGQVGAMQVLVDLPVSAGFRLGF